MWLFAVMLDLSKFDIILKWTGNVYGQIRLKCARIKQSFRDLYYNILRVFLSHKRQVSRIALHFFKEILIEDFVRPFCDLNLFHASVHLPYPRELFLNVYADIDVI
jgi:hypothetical protein